MTKAKSHFRYIARSYDAAGVLLGEADVTNVMPDEALAHVLDVLLKGGGQYSAWYVGLFEGNYTPDGDDTMATFPAAAVELTAYDGTRKAIVFGDIDAGRVDNEASPCVFTGTTSGKQVQGAFICAASAKGATTGPLLSAVKFPSPLPLGNGGRIEVLTPFDFASA